MKKVIFVLMAAALSLAAHAQNGTLSLKVTDEFLESLPYGQLYIVEKPDGRFSDPQWVGNTNRKRFDFSPGNYVFEVRANAFVSQRFEVTIVAESVVEKAVVMQPLSHELEAVNITGIRAREKTPIAQTNISKAEIEERNDGRDIPYILEQTPSVVTFSDAGAGIGYTGLRIRGSDQTRINATINGIPINDGESQGIFWVNMPDMASSMNSVQIQRGVGTSTQGAGAFGATINIETETGSEEAYTHVDLGAGSFNTRRTSLQVGTGMLGESREKGLWNVNARLSQITSDGYVDRGSSLLQSYYFSAAYHKKNTSVNFITFGGNQRTYQAWYGVDAATLETDRRFNYAGAIYDDNWNVVDFYDGETDNYRQDHYQIHINHKFNSRWNLNVAGHYTRGRGFYEQYRQNNSLASYQLPPVITGGDTVTHSDLVRELWLDNDFYGGVYHLSYQQKNLDVIIGGGYNFYDGDHFGRVTWARFASEGQPDHEFYFNTGQKTDWNQFVKAYYTLPNKIILFGDVQVRGVDYRAFGQDRNLSNIDVEDQLLFFNPKAGASWWVNPNTNIYASVAVANREPFRRDYLEADPLEQPRHERLIDYEAGVRFRKGRFTVETNLYFMDYYDQLVLTGELTDVGYALRQNVGRSYRTGIEIDARYTSSDQRFTWAVNAAFSENVNLDWVTGVDSLGNVSRERTPISYSPNVILGNTFAYRIRPNLQISLMTRYVGQQYVTNDGLEEARLPHYSVTDMRLRYMPWKKGKQSLEMSLFVNNILGLSEYSDAQWINNGFLSRGYSANAYYAGDMYYFPQAGINFLFNLSLRL